MFEEYRIIDADCHVLEPTDLWETYLEPAFKSYALSKELEVAGEKIYYNISKELGFRGQIANLRDYMVYGVSGYDPTATVKAIKKMGSDMAFLYPTVGLWLLAIDTMEPRLAGAFVRAYNNWLRDFCSYDSQLLRGVGVINLHDPVEMVPELRRIAEFGWKAVCLRPNPIKGRMLSDPVYEPFWSECEQLNITVSLHEGTHAKVPSAGADRFHSRFAMHACSHPLEQMMALLALIEGGVLERHPNLQVGLLESGCGWLPYWLWRLDEVEYKHFAWEVKENVKMRPSDYFRRQCFIAVEPSEPYLLELINYIGTDNLILGSDYPHIDHDPNVIANLIALEDKLSRETIRKILWYNPCRFYRQE